MGIVNVTPDSFSDGGQHDSSAKAIEHGLRLISDGADILDIGGESSRPGATSVSLDEELNRVIPVVRELARVTNMPISVDTVKAPVARAALEAGACIINDITALQGDADMVNVVREFNAGIVLMHMQGTPTTMQVNPTYTDVVQDIAAFFEERLAFTDQHGIDRETIALDPGVGFGKTQEHNLDILRKMECYQRLGRPVCLGVSRKGLIGLIINRPRHQRAVGSVAIAAFAIVKGSAQMIRVHDVAEHRDAVLMLEALGNLQSIDSHHPRPTLNENHAKP
ncbi:MAG: dihydropteroate synthase [Planctomycetes bacterium]|nr:dihydropteroate synthase [Planctomycetota bacterium]